MFDDFDSLLLVSLAGFTSFDLIKRFVTATLARVKRHNQNLYHSSEI